MRWPIPKRWRNFVIGRSWLIENGTVAFIQQIGGSAIHQRGLFRVMTTGSPMALPALASSAPRRIVMF